MKVIFAGSRIQDSPDADVVNPAGQQNEINVRGIRDFIDLVPNGRSVEGDFLIDSGLMSCRSAPTTAPECAVKNTSHFGVPRA